MDGEKAALFSSRLQKALEMRGKRPADLAAETGISKSTLSRYLAGRYEPKPGNLYLIANALDVNVQWLRGYDNDLDVRVARAASILFPSREEFDRMIDNALSKVESAPDQTLVMEALDLFDSLTPEMQERSIRFLSLSPKEQDEALEFLSYAPELRQAAMTLMRAPREAKA